MRCDGEWLLCDDAVVRPVFRVEIAGTDNVWRSMELLADTGADRTVISANVFETLGFALPDEEHQIGGIGGVIGAFSIASRIRFMREDGTPVVFRGEYLACTEQSSLDMSVLGRDILDLFALIVDRQQGVLAMLGGQHSYAITASQAASS
jgi:hypothetical protein